MPKAIITPQNLPAPNGYTESYSVRFRIISDNQNNFSYWSPIFEIPLNISYTPSAAGVRHSGGIVTAAWLPVENIYRYDIWITWDNGANPATWVYYERTSTTSLNLAVPAGKNKFSIRIYREVNPTTEQFPNFLLYETLDVGV
jgi:hypothetical protein